MLARKVSAHLKANSLARFSDLMESEILPWLRDQEGFLDLVTLVAPDGREIATITFWDHPANAQPYNPNAYPAALKNLGELLDGSPYVKTFQVVSSTLHNPDAPRLLQAEELVRGSDSGRLDYRSYETNA